MPHINYHRVKKIIAQFKTAKNAIWVELYINKGPDPLGEGEDICLFFEDEKTAARFAEAVNRAFDAGSIAREQDAEENPYWNP